VAEGKERVKQHIRSYSQFEIQILFQMRQVGVLWRFNG